MAYVLQRACHSADEFHERTEKKCQKKRKGNYGPEGLKLPAEYSETGKSLNDRRADMTIMIIKPRGYSGRPDCQTRQSAQGAKRQDLPGEMLAPEICSRAFGM